MFSPLRFLKIPKTIKTINLRVLFSDFAHAADPSFFSASTSRHLGVSHLSVRRRSRMCFAQGERRRSGDFWRNAGLQERPGSQLWTIWGSPGDTCGPKASILLHRGSHCGTFPDPWVKVADVAKTCNLLRFSHVSATRFKFGPSF